MAWLERSERGRARELAGFVVWGALGGAAWCGATASGGEPGPAAPPAAAVQGSAADRPVSVLVADRDAGQVVALDADLLEVRRFAAPHAVELEVRADGRIWVACASALGPLGPHWLRKYTDRGQIELELAIQPLYDLACLDGDRALVVTARPDGIREASAVSSGGQVSVLLRSAALSAVAGRQGRVAVAAHDGWVRSFAGGVNFGLLHERHFGGVLADVAPGPLRGSFYVLDVAGGPSQRRVALLDETLASVWEKPLGCGALQLCVTPDRQRIWLADGPGRFARRLGPTGAVEIPFATLPLAGCERGVADSRGGAIFAAPGGLVRLGVDGAVLPGQGGFEFLVDVDRRGPP